MTWKEAREAYAAKSLTAEELKPSWNKELAEQSGLDRIPPEQTQPLFDNKWSPSDAAQHMVTVWRFKGCPLEWV